MAPVASYYNNYPSYTLPAPDNIQDQEEDQPKFEPLCHKLGCFQLPPLVFGAATLSHHYNDLNSFLQTDIPFRVVRLALRYGITAFDTSPYYGSSEVVLGQILKALGLEFPRSSYMLMTKCGRYGLDKSDFDYSPETIRASVARSLERLNTDFLDVVYLHDAEFVASPIYPKDRTGYPKDAFSDSSGAWGLDQASRRQIRGSGDQIILDALSELFKLKQEGKIKAVGITGYSLPVLLRLSTLAAAQPSLKPIDMVLTFCHLTLQNSSLIEFLPLFEEWGQVSQVIAASPLSMGLLTSNPPVWHPAPGPLQQLSNEADQLCKSERTSLAATALHYALHHHNHNQGHKNMNPVVIGLSTLKEVHEAMHVFQTGDVVEGGNHRELEGKIKTMYQTAGFQGWSWASPPHE